MSDNDDLTLPADTENTENSDKKGSFIDMMLGKSDEKVIDSETMIQDTQKRIWSSLKKGIEYAATVDRSDAYLRKHVHEKQSMFVMYVDLVGSTDITLTLPEEKVAIIISSFAQEMAYAIKNHSGYVLKFVGDAVIGYFVHSSTLIAADNAVSCAKSMVKIIDEGINPILNQYDYPDLFIKIGIDFGNNMIVRYGSDEEKWCNTAQLAVYGILLFLINLLVSLIEPLSKHPLPTTINGLSAFFINSLILL